MLSSLVRVNQIRYNDHNASMCHLDQWVIKARNGQTIRATHGQVQSLWPISTLFVCIHTDTKMHPVLQWKHQIFQTSTPLLLPSVTVFPPFSSFVLWAVLTRALLIQLASCRNTGDYTCLNH